MQKLCGLYRQESRILYEQAPPCHLNTPNAIASNKPARNTDRKGSVCFGKVG